MEAIDPVIHRQTPLGHPKPGAYLIVDMKFSRLSSRLPRRKQRQTAVGDIEVGCAHCNKQWRRVCRDVDVHQRGTVEGNKKVRRRIGALRERSPNCNATARREPHDADARRVHAPCA